VRYSSFEDEEVADGSDQSRERPRQRPKKQLESGRDRLRRAETRLDLLLDDAYERFRRGETTVREMNVERNRSIRAFNGLGQAENIRYRHLLRREIPS